NQKDIANFRVTGETAGIVTVKAIMGEYKSTNTPADLRNAVVLQGVPGDIAEAIDKAYDGVPDGTIGVVLNCGTCAATAPTFTNGTTVCGTSDYDTTSGNLCTVALTLDH
ncbi:MAG: hypothetical protein L7F77_04685, partial [Candidatus Magnetominusculus sp. LBB02]|nr:hypothetical protein [Candidatus Magnetominusculus sp. LBB02]